MHYTRLRKSSLTVTFAALLAAIMLSGSLNSSAASVQTGDESALRVLTQNFYGLCEKKDLDGFISLWSPQSPDLATRQRQASAVFASDARIGSAKLNVRDIQINSLEARVRLDVELSGFEPSALAFYSATGKTKRVLRFRKEDGEWKIWQEISAFEELAVKLLGAETDDNRELLLKGNEELINTDLAAACNIQAGSLSRSANYSKAVAAYKLGYRFAIQAKDWARAERSLSSIGQTLHKLGQFIEALNYYEESLKLSRPINDGERIADTLNKMGLVYDDSGDYVKAKSLFEESLSFLEKAQDKPAKFATLAETLLSVARNNYQQGNHDEAIKLFRRCLELREGVLKQEPTNRYGLAQVLNGLGLVYTELGNYPEALRYFEKSLTEAQAINRDVQGLPLNIGTVYEKLGNAGLADKYFQDDLKASRQKNNAQAIAQALINIGLFKQTNGNRESAKDALIEALTISRGIGQKDLTSKALNSLGVASHVQKNFAEAMGHYQESLTLRNELNDQEGIADTSNNLAYLYLEQGDSTNALKFAADANAIARQIAKLELVWRTYTTLGRIHLALNQLDKAQESFNAAIKTIEQMRSNVAGDEAQSQAFFENKTTPYLMLGESLIRQNKSGVAFEYTERAKARTLLDVLQKGRLNFSKVMTAAEQERERKLNNELASLNTQFYDEQIRQPQNKSRLTEMTQQLEKARLDYEDFRIKLYAAHPELKVQRGEAKTLTLAEAGALLPNEKTALVEYVVTPERSHLFVVTKAKTGEPKLKVYPLVIKRDELAAKVEQFRSQLAGRDARFGKLASELYAQLLKPAMADLPAQTRLVIVPDGPLWELPFQALLTERNRYVLQDHVVSYAPSLTVLREMSKVKREPASAQKSSLLAFGDPKLGGQSLTRAQSLMGTTFEQLPEARTQVETLRKFYDANRSKVFIGETATEEQYKAEAGNYDILHFATHGVLNDRNPLYSHLLLAQPETASKDAKEDGMLEAWEIMQMDLRADMAVLSACETARGRVGAGEGMIGLTWAMFVAGVPTTVVSQWKVRADSTADLMVEFHRLLQARGAKGATRWTRSEALQQAAMKLLADPKYRHPFYWAGFVLIGKT